MTRYVLTLIGPDRPGILSALSASVRELEGNWLASRMARLAGQFAGVVEIEIPKDNSAKLHDLLAKLRGDGLEVAVTPGHAHAPAAGPCWRIDLLGNDRPGIVREVSRAVAAAGGNIEELESRVSSSPMSGSPMFELQGTVHLPADADPRTLQQALEAIGADLSVDIRLTADNGGTPG